MNHAPRIIKTKETAMIPSTVGRVPQQTAHHVNERIRQRTEERIARIANAGPRAIERRLAELNREWDIERTLEANAAAAVLIGSALGTLVDRRFFAIPAVVAGFLLQHAIQGWCPPLPVFRRAGVRTAHEIETERCRLNDLPEHSKIG
jgi:F0F1-type ATP synthase assembly protein I